MLQEVRDQVGSFFKWVRMMHTSYRKERLAQRLRDEVCFRDAPNLKKYFRGFKNSVCPLFKGVLYNCWKAYRSTEHLSESSLDNFQFREGPKTPTTEPARTISTVSAGRSAVTAGCHTGNLSKFAGNLAQLTQQTDIQAYFAGNIVVNLRLPYSKSIKFCW